MTKANLTPTIQLHRDDTASASEERSTIEAAEVEEAAETGSTSGPTTAPWECRCQEATDRSVQAAASSCHHRQAESLRFPD
jgi:hypothetical protein